MPPRAPPRLTSAHVTPQKLIKRTVFADHVKFLTTRQDQLLEQLRELAAGGLDRAKEEYEKALLAWGASPTVSVSTSSDFRA